MLYLGAILTVAAIHFLALVSPGPDFILTSQTSIAHSRRAGLLVALGLALGMLVHITYSLVGIGIIIARSIVLFSVIKFLGAGYLMYIGYKSLRAKSQPEGEIVSAGTGEDLPAWAAIRRGFFTNVTNPKVTLFFLSIFTLVINPATPIGVKLIMGFEMFLATLLWFSLVATVFSHSIVKRRIGKVQRYVEKTMGAILIALGIRLAFASAK